MLKIRLSRRGKKSQPSYSVVVQEHSAPVKKKFIEELGHYMPATTEKTFHVNVERVKHWLSVGAQPSDAVAVQLRKAGMDGMDKFIAPRDKKRRPTKEPAPVVEAPKAAPVRKLLLSLWLLRRRRKKLLPRWWLKKRWWLKSRRRKKQNLNKPFLVQYSCTSFLHSNPNSHDGRREPKY